MIVKKKPTFGGALFAGVNHSVIDSPAFAALSGEAVRLLLIMARQYDGRNNGWMHAAHTYCRTRGIASESTLKRAVSSLISHGFIYRTRCHGIDPVLGKNVPARYALTWLPITENRKGLYFDGFVFNAFDKLIPEKNQGYQNCRADPPKSVVSQWKSRGEKSESIPIRTVVSATGKPAGESVKTVAFEQLPVYVSVYGGSREVTETRAVIVHQLLESGRHNLSGKVLAFRPLSTSLNQPIYKHTPAFAA